MWTSVGWTTRPPTTRQDERPADHRRRAGPELLMVCRAQFNTLSVVSPALEPILNCDRSDHRRGRKPGTIDTRQCFISVGFEEVVGSELRSSTPTCFRKPVDWPTCLSALGPGRRRYGPTGGHRTRGPPRRSDPPAEPLRFSTA